MLGAGADELRVLGLQQRRSSGSYGSRDELLQDPVLFPADKSAGPRWARSDGLALM